MPSPDLSYEKLAEPMARIEGESRPLPGNSSTSSTSSPGTQPLQAGWPRDTFLWHGMEQSEGVLPSAGPSPTVLLGEATAKVLSKMLGDKITLHQKTFPISGTYKYQGPMNSTLILDLVAMQELLHRPGKVTSFNVRLLHPERKEAVAETKKRLEQAYPDLLWSETGDIAEQNRVLNLMQAVAWIMSVIALIMGWMIIVNTMIMSTMERTVEIGILAAIGWSSRRILIMIVSEGLWLSVIGGASGAFLALSWSVFWLSFPRQKDSWTSGLRGA